MGCPSMNMSMNTCLVKEAANLTVAGAWSAGGAHPVILEAGAAAGVRPAVALVHAVVLGAEMVGGAPAGCRGELGGLEEALVAGVVLCG